MESTISRFRVSGEPIFMWGCKYVYQDNATNLVSVLISTISKKLSFRTLLHQHGGANPQPSTLNLQPSTLNPQTSTLHPPPSTLKPQP
ncbi:hypothetical protein T484DRAFT_2297774 [Baffinella frigidus]|nr:hypothetical protein T484DRAFT_2297774 [Cryptophyta sp. CCMP2293]